MQDNDITELLQQQVTTASQDQQAVNIIGGNSKPFYGNIPHTDNQLESINTAEHTGIVDYEPSELYITARSGTLLKNLEQRLAEEQQMLPFEPASFADTATIGGTIACGISGPRRPFSGACRDSILGIDIINGLGESLSFGGHVMKNVAGYDVSRGMCGSLGTLGLITQVSLKVIPKPDVESTVVIATNFTGACQILAELRKITLPISANYFADEHLYLRVNLSIDELKKFNQQHHAKIHHEPQFWENVREHRNNFFLQDTPLWRCSLPIGSPALELSGDMVAEWNAGLHWYKTQESAERVRQLCQLAGGHAQLFSQKHGHESFSQPAANMFELHKRIKAAFDPHAIFNPNRLFIGL
jgi:glycolate oxidase FAD binding subunit